MMALPDTITAADAAYAEWQTQEQLRIGARNQFLAGIYDSIVTLAASFMPADVRPYLKFNGDKTAHFYSNRPVTLSLELPDCKPIELVISAETGVDVTLRVDGVLHRSLATAIGAAHQP